MFKFGTIKFYVDRTYIWNFYKEVYGTFDEYNQYGQVIQDFAKEHNCTVDKHFTNIFRCSEADYLILKLRHPELISEDQ